MLERGDTGSQAGPAHASAVARRAPRSARAGARGRADRGGAWTRLRLLRCCAMWRSLDEPALQARAGSACRRRPAVCRGRATGGQLSLQARADPGRGLRQPAQEPPAGAAPTRRRTPCDDPERATAEPEVIAHHFTQAGLDDLAIEWWGKAGDQALRRSAFQEAIAHLGKAIAMADEAGATSPNPTQDAAEISQRLKLQTDYGQAMMWSKGFAAEETKAAFARAGELAGRADHFLERFALLRGQWAASCTRGELRSVRELALTFLREAEDVGRVKEAGIANFWLGLVAFWHGDFVEARTYHERALATPDPNPDLKSSGT